MTDKAQTGVPGLDEILAGGLPRDRLYLIEGKPGAGKTTLAIQFLIEGVQRGEKALYVTLSETKSELESVAESHGWDLEGIAIIELSAVERAIVAKGTTALFQPAEVELTQLVKLLMDEIERLHPARLVLDSLSEMRLLSQSALRYRREILSLKQALAKLGCTVLLLDDGSSEGADVQIHSIVHGGIALASAPLRYGIFRRSLSVTKLRGVRFREGAHDYVIVKGGLRVFPRLIAAEHLGSFTKSSASSGNADLDAMLGGGLHFGTSNLLIGPAGSGKSTVGSMFAYEGCKRGLKVCYYVFDETKATLCDRARAMRIGFDEHIESGRLTLHQVDPAEISPGELAARICGAVEHEGARIIVLDSLNGYVNAMPQEEFLHLHLHELLSYLNQQGVMTVMVLAQHGLIDPMGAPVDISYLADSVILTRFFEAVGSIRKAVSIIKKRSGPHESTVRELTMSIGGVHVGPPLAEFQGVLTGVPTILGIGR
jgi:circadian clock protein KaiC